MDTLGSGGYGLPCSQVQECSVPSRQRGGWEATEEYIQLGRLPMQPPPVNHCCYLFYVCRKQPYSTFMLMKSESKLHSFHNEFFST